MPSTAPLLDIRGLSVALPAGGDRPEAISDVTMSVGAGECLCLVGESGSGKSVTGQAVMGLLPRALRQLGGEILFQGKPLPPAHSEEMRRLRGARIAVISQEPVASLDPVMSVWRQIDEVLRVHGMKGKAARRARAIELLSAVRLPDPERILRSYPHQLSGGQAQRVVIAIALALKPALLIADEPTTALDVTTQAEILALLARLRSETGAGLLFVTHDLGVVADIADRVAVMQTGRIVEAGTRDEIFAHPRHPYTRRLIEALPQRPEGPPRDITGEIALEARGLTLTYAIPGPGFSRILTDAVRNVSLSLRRGETLGVVGESGSGKSSLIKCLLHLETPSAGEVTICGTTTPKGRDLPRDLRRRIQLVQQDPWSALDPRQSIGRAISEAAIIHGAPPAEARARTLDLLARVGLPPQAYDRYPHEFSGGQRQRICIIRALAPAPEILVADEAVSALDVSIQAQILKLFRELQDEMGFAMVFVTHDLRVAAAICDRVLVMRRGEVVEEGTALDVLDHPRHDYTRALVAAMPDRQDFARSALRQTSPAIPVSAAEAAP